MPGSRIWSDAFDKLASNSFNSSMSNSSSSTLSSASPPAFAELLGPSPAELSFTWSWIQLKISKTRYEHAYLFYASAGMWTKEIRKLVSFFFYWLWWGVWGGPFVLDRKVISAAWIQQMMQFSIAWPQCILCSSLLDLNLWENFVANITIF